MALSARFLRFLFVGALNSAFGLTVYSGLILLHNPTWLALIGSNAAGLVFNFFTTGGLVFRDLSPARALGFAAVYLIVYLTNLGLLYTLKHVLTNVILIQALLVLPMALASYLLMTHFVYKTKTP